MTSRAMIAAATLASALALAGCQQETKTPEPVRPVLSRIIDSGPGEGTVSVGVIEPRYQTNIGSRVLGRLEPGALTPVQRFGNALAAALLRACFGARATDLGPFRAIRWSALERLGMRDRDYGWTVEMQARAARAGLRVVEVPVRARPRAAGRSKVSGTLRGVLGAGTKILWTILRVRMGA